MDTDLLSDFEARGLVHQSTDAAGLRAWLATPGRRVYAGFDPTADSLHVGHLVALVLLRRVAAAGHEPVALVGGATGMIGDPSGRSEERNLLSPAELAANVAGVERQIRGVLESAGQRVHVVNNGDWMRGVGYLEFLRDVGKHVPLSQMIAKDSVKSRLERDGGLSYTEFSYMLLQAYDFYHLARVHGCELQIGGSDQWGNITAGMDLVRKKLDRRAWGLTLPLITKADGTKFGKTEGGTVWLDPRRTSVYKFYQFWIQTDDRDVVRYLKFFTFLSADEISSLEQDHLANPGGRAAHRALAREVTALIHGEAACSDAIRATEILFGAPLDGLTVGTLGILESEIQGAVASAADFSTGIPLTDALVTAGLCSSKGQARKDIEAGGIYINGTRTQDTSRLLTPADLLHNRATLLRKGKRAWALLSRSSD
jgi:tyrosyl-tRNA synthetase